jgi:hypothetical protein
VTRRATMVSSRYFSLDMCYGREEVFVPEPFSLAAGTSAVNAE